MLPADRETTTVGPSSAPRPRGRTEVVLPSGSIIATRYRIVSLLGRGGMGEVYRADDLTLGAAVALKFLPADLAGDSARVEALLEEVRLARQVSHPNVCRVHDIGTTENGHPFLAMEYVDGEDLARLLQRIGRLPREKAIDIGRELCHSLDAVHQQGVVHRDLKPANVMVDSRGRVRLTDFGIASLRERAEGIAGTPAYMAPELFHGGAATAASDIFALGLVLCEIFTGRRPSAASLQELARLDPDGPAPAPASPFAELDEQIRAVLGLCLSAEPSARPSAAWVAASLGGGDALRATLSAGHTPSPQAIALAGRSGTLNTRAAAACLAVVIVLMPLSYMLGERVSMRSYRPLPDSPAALQFKVREHLRALGASEAGHWASGVDSNETLLDAATVLSPAEQTTFLASAPTSPVFFWYRTRPEPLVPLAAISPTRTDPAPTSGDVSITVNPDGSLISFERQLPRVVDANVEAGPAPDWPRIFALAGLDFATFRTMAPRVAGEGATGDTRLAWLEQNGGPLGPRRVEASTFRNTVVSFSTVYDTTLREGSSVAIAPGTTMRTLARRVFAIMRDSLLLIGAVVAWRQVRSGRADLRGAARLGLWLLVLTVAGDLLMRERLLATLGDDPIFRRLPAALARTAQVVVFYLAVEPFIRRHAPHKFIAWSRLLSGRATDPLVGRDLLIGVLAGIAAQLLAFASFFVEIRIVGPATAALGTPALASEVSQSIGRLLDLVVDSIELTLFMTLMYAASLSVTRRTWAAIMPPVVVAMALVLASYSHWSGAVLGALTLPIFFGVFLRVGTLATAATCAAFYLLNLVPVCDPEHWRFAATLVPALLVVSLACYGFVISTGVLRRGPQLMDPSEAAL